MLKSLKASLKAKFILAFGLMILVIFLVGGFYLVDAKARELSGDLVENVQIYARLTGNKVVKEYNQFLVPGNFIAFAGEMADLLDDSEAIYGLSLLSYVGEVLYDSEEEALERYSGEEYRPVEDENLLERVQARNLSILLEDGRVLYVLLDGNRNWIYVGSNEELVDSPGERGRVVNLVVPQNDAFGVVYYVTYDALEASLGASQLQIGIIALLGLLLTLMLAYMISESITRPLKSLKAGALKIGQGDFSAKVKVTTEDEIGVLGKTFNKMAKDLAASTEAMLYQERVTKELELASQIQKDLLPTDELEMKSFDLSGGLVPATEIGGDAFDYIEMGSGRYMVYLGDVTGHGVPAGIISSIANAVLYGARKSKDLKEIIGILNEVLMEKTAMKMFMSMALLMWNEKSSTATYANAGHPPVLHYDAKKKKVTELKIPGIALGLKKDLEALIKPHKIKMKKNDVLVMYSDGIPEAVCGKGKQYGEARLIKVLEDAAKDLYTAKGIKNAILSDVVQHIGKSAHQDDITVVVLKKK
jgi:serine phosphatase RsbU (regulator of sigma subunit)